MIHIRAVSPTDVTPRLVETLGANAGVVNLVVLPRVAHNPGGYSLQFDVITAEANRVIDELRHLRDRRGSIVIENIDTSISALAAQAERREPSRANFSPIWEEAEARIRGRGTYRSSWFVLLAIAGIIGVFVSVTTIPAAADAGLQIASGEWNEAGRAFLQLVVNVVILIGVGAVGLAVQWRIWSRAGWRATTT